MRSKAEITYNRSCTVESVNYLKWKEAVWLEQGAGRTAMQDSQETEGGCQASQGLLNLKSFSPE